jgi:uncharacterized membrane protein YkvA (DUF1232 family)
MPEHDKPQATLPRTTTPAVFSAQALWGKLARTAKKLGRETVEKILWLYYASQRPETPRWAKTLVFGALAYFILPTDAIPDFIPITGYTDDMAAIAAAVTTIAVYINRDVKEKTAEKLKRWFGEDTPSES